MIELSPQSKQKLLRLINAVLISAIIIALIYFIFKYMFPFIIIILLSWLLQKPIRQLQKTLKINRLLATSLTFLITFLLIGLNLAMIFIYFFNSVNHLFNQLPLYLENTIDIFKQSFNYMISHTLVHLDHFFSSFHFSIVDYLNETIDTLYQTIIEFSQQLTNQLIPIIGQTIVQTAQLTSTTIIILIGTFLLSKDWCYYQENARNIIPKRGRSLLLEIKMQFIKTAWGYLRAQVALSCITTAILIVGFHILRLNNPIVLAFIFGIIDLFPFVGVGLLMWPWLIYSLFSGTFSLTIQLAVIYSFLLLIRQVTEPRLVSKQLGTNPLLVICLAYLAYTLLGLWGILMTPVILISLQALRASNLIAMVINYVKCGEFHN
ncbi:sporulation integral membrane protein YtvI [Amphibacillus jilinensis]|uniref:sporulation integral membrane protein YtvI n=1 Tax=Amphibacillus jilinensis TaxID=1216008 RepID=UPI0002FD73CF|nr:sporulation integral membrane protein YtvI [Amphibacillus jilinensis]